MYGGFAVPMKIFKHCLICRKMVFKQYDTIKYRALNEEYQEEVYTAYVHKKCADTFHTEENEFMAGLDYHDDESL